MKSYVYTAIRNSIAYQGRHLAGCEIQHPFAVIRGSRIGGSSVVMQTGMYDWAIDLMIAVHRSLETDDPMAWLNSSELFNLKGYAWDLPRWFGEEAPHNFVCEEIIVPIYERYRNDEDKAKQVLHEIVQGLFRTPDDLYVPLLERMFMVGVREADGVCFNREFLEGLEFGRREVYYGFEPDLKTKLSSAESCETRAFGSVNVRAHFGVPSLKHQFMEVKLAEAESGQHLLIYDRYNGEPNEFYELRMNGHNHRFIEHEQPSDIKMYQFSGGWISPMLWLCPSETRGLSKQDELSLLEQSVTVRSENVLSASDILGDINSLLEELGEDDIQFSEKTDHKDDLVEDSEQAETGAQEESTKTDVVEKPESVIDSGGRAKGTRKRTGDRIAKIKF